MTENGWKEIGKNGRQTEQTWRSNFVKSSESKKFEEFVLTKENKLIIMGLQISSTFPVAPEGNFYIHLIY